MSSSLNGYTDNYVDRRTYLIYIDMFNTGGFYSTPGLLSSASEATQTKIGKLRTGLLW